MASHNGSLPNILKGLQELINNHNDNEVDGDIIKADENIIMIDDHDQEIW